MPYKESSKIHLQGQTKAATYKETGAAQKSVIVGFWGCKARNHDLPFLLTLDLQKKAKKGSAC